MMRLPSLMYYTKLMAKDEEASGLLSEFSEYKDQKEFSGRTEGDYYSIASPTREATMINDHSIWDELVSILHYSIPLIITFLVGFGNRVWDVWFLGKTGSRDMAVASLGYLFATVAGVSMGTGILTAIDTLVAQAFTGAKNPHTIGVIFQRGLAIMFVFGSLISILWVNAEFILVSMGQDPELTSMAQTYIIFSIPYLFLSYANTTIRKFLQSIGEMKITMYIVFILFPINIVSNHFFLIYLNLSYIGAALHVSLISFLFLLSYIIYLTYFSPALKSFWPGLTKEAFHGWSEFLKLGIPGMLSVSTDWAFEVCALLTGVLGQTSLAAQSVVLTINTLLLMIPAGFSTGMAVRLGHLLGANEPRKAKLCVILSTCSGAFFTLFNSSLLYVYRETIANHFSTDSDVIEAIVQLLTVACLCHFIMGFGIVLSCTLNALGKQTIVAGLNLVSYYLIGLPSGLYLTYRCQWGLEGIWSGVAVSGIIKSVCELIVIFYIIDWDHECKLAANRVNNQEYTLVA
ncbi:hypothetical protein G6F62_007669 [Rhizopus arrhizus]|nr:hypothetical protein G6F24_009774 [Rhizopus arrhizus]KAG0784658.1 hypothetical protein G6F21_009766 [Rhizopus arrhizus]KAG0785699.1 hypothetical protein G6F22_007873 [Rhizopus arrhizus]KAG0810326.1 hypothetical protein G6F20_008051 [Rhizopus arrhizus]KAG0824335.1 hypothetical protein G6F19_010370 [Rhizopus arrhizus]